MANLKTSRVVPELSVEQIEAEVEKMQAEGARTEAWMSARARSKMRDLEDKDKELRHAFEAGYRMASDNSFLAPLTGFGVAMLILLIASFFSDHFSLF